MIPEFNAFDPYLLIIWPQSWIILLLGCLAIESVTVHQINTVTHTYAMPVCIFILSILCLLEIARLLHNNKDTDTSEDDCDSN